MTTEDNVANHIYNELNPREDQPTGSLLYSIRESYVDEYAKRLRGVYATDDAKRNEELNNFRRDFDNAIVKQTARGSVDQNADASAFLSEKEKKATEATKGIFGMLMDSILGGLGFLGNLLGAALKFMGFDNLAAKFITDSTSDKSEADKVRDHRAAGMANALGEVVNVRGMEVQLTSDEQAQLYRQFKAQDFDRPVERNPLPLNRAPNATNEADQVNKPPVAHDAGFDAPPGSTPDGRPQTPAVEPPVNRIEV